MNRSATPGPARSDPSGAEPSDYLARVLERKREEIAALRPREAEWRAIAADLPPARPWARALRRPRHVALIAEIKRRAPSAGELDRDLVPEALAHTYERAGASALSVLTDSDFDGELADLTRARNAVTIPALRKDFILDPVQVWESRVAAADAILLIVRALDETRLSELLAVAGEAGLGALVEVHDEEELSRAIASGAPVLGINNRDLRTLATGLELTRRLSSAVPADRLLVAESGIESAEQVRDLGAHGVDAVLVGSALVRHAVPGCLAAALAGQPRVPRP